MRETVCDVDASALKLEKKYLAASVCGNVLVGCVGTMLAFVADSQAILLDGLFNLTYFATGLFTVKVATLVAGGDDDRFPHGYAFFEPLVNGIKGTLVLGVSVHGGGWRGSRLDDGRTRNCRGHRHRLRHFCFGYLRCGGLDHEARHARNQQPAGRG